MLSNKIKIFFLAIAFAFLPRICLASLISIQSNTGSNGVFSYNVSAGNESLTFGGDNMLVTKIPSKGILELDSPAGWTSEVESLETAMWFCTNEVCVLSDNPVNFTINSSIAAWTNYSSESELYPAGMVIGEVYETNGTRYSNNSGTNNVIMSENIVGYEKFSFIGPVVPEPFPALIFSLFGLILFYFRAIHN